MFKTMQKILSHEDMWFWMIASLIFSVATAGSLIVEGMTLSIAGLYLNEAYSAMITAVVVFMVISLVPVINYRLNRRFSDKVDI